VKDPQGTTLGTVTSVAKSGNAFNALALVRKSACEPGTEIQIAASRLKVDACAPYA
jgi:hypothetical protein